MKEEKKPKIRILYLCTGNSCRSQMAEALTNSLKGDFIEAYSAGVDPKGVDPRAVQAMAELGIDISGQKSKSTDDILDMDIDFDYVITLCDSARKSCPAFPARIAVLHVGFDDPPKLAAGAASEEEAMEHYRRVRDEIWDFVLTLPESLEQKGQNSG